MEERWRILYMTKKDIKQAAVDAIAVVEEFAEGQLKDL